MARNKNIELRKYVLALHRQGVPRSDIARHAGRSVGFIGHLIKQIDRDDYLEKRIGRRGLGDRNKDALDYLTKLLETDEFTQGQYRNGNWSIDIVTKRCRDAGINVRPVIVHYLLKRLGYGKRWVKV